MLLQSVGMGYAKRITFKPDTLNAPENYFWSDSHPEGLGMEPRAIDPGMKFTISGNGVCRFWNVVNSDLAARQHESTRCLETVIQFGFVYSLFIYVNVRA